MTTAKKLFTSEDLLAMPDDGKRYELIRGELIEMPPASHNSRQSRAAVWAADRQLRGGA